MSRAYVVTCDRCKVVVTRRTGPSYVLRIERFTPPSTLENAEPMDLCEPCAEAVGLTELGVFR